MIRGGQPVGVVNLGSRWGIVSAIASTTALLIASHSVEAMELAGQTAQLASDSKTPPRPGAGEGVLRSYGLDELDRLSRSRMVETLLIVSVGAAAAVTGAAMGGLTFAIATGAAGVYVMMSLP